MSRPTSAAASKSWPSLGSWHGANRYVGTSVTISYSPDGHRIAGGGNWPKITIWDSKSGEEVFCCDGHTGSVQAIVFSPLGDLLASGGGDQYVRVWNALTGNLTWSKKLHKDILRGLSYDSTGQWLASVGEDGRLIIWQARKWEIHLNLKQPSPILCVSFSPNSEFLALGSRDGTLLVWDLRTRSEIGKWQAHAQDVSFIGFSPDSRLLVSGGVDDTDHRHRRELASIKVWEAVMWRNTLSINFDYTGGWLHGSVSPRGTYVAGKTGASDVAIWNYQTGEQSYLLKGHYTTVYSTLFSPDGQYLASSSKDGSIRIWDVQTGMCVHLIIQYKDCRGARFTDIKGLDARAGSFSFRIGVAYGGEEEQKGFVLHGVLLARHAPHAPTPFAQVVTHDTTSPSVT